MINEQVKFISKKSIQFLPADLDPWKAESYSHDGIYYSNKNQYYFFIFNGAMGSVPKALFEGIFHEANPSPNIISAGFNEDFFLKTIAMLTSNTDNYKKL